MAIAKVQNWDTGASNIASGTAFSATNILAAGNYICCFIVSADSTGVGTGAVTSTIGGTWARVGTANQLGARTLEFWALTSASGSNKAVTVTTQNAVTYAAACYEISGAGSYGDGGIATATSTAPSLTVSGFQTGALVLVGAKNGGSFSASPGGSWNDYNANWLTNGNGNALDDQIAPSTASLTATWTDTSQIWGTSGMYFNPATQVSSSHWAPPLPGWGAAL